VVNNCRSPTRIHKCPSTALQNTVKTLASRRGLDCFSGKRCKQDLGQVPTDDRWHPQDRSNREKAIWQAERTRSRFTIFRSSAALRTKTIARFLQSNIASTTGQRAISAPHPSLLFSLLSSFSPTSPLCQTWHSTFASRCQAPRFCSFAKSRARAIIRIGQAILIDWMLRTYTPGFPRQDFSEGRQGPLVANAS